MPLDALLVINELNNRQVSDPVTGLLPNPPVPPHVPETVGYFDVDGDNYVSPRDALLIINELNRSSVAAAAPKRSEKPSCRRRTGAATDPIPAPV